MRPRSVRSLALAAALPLLAAAPDLGRAAPPTSYALGAYPIAPGGIALEFPIAGKLRGEVDAYVLAQGTYWDANPFAYLSGASPAVFVHWDADPNLRLSAGFQELFYLQVAPMGIPDGHEQRLVARARLQQPRGQAALYELLQLDVRSFDQPGFGHVVAFRPRLRIGQGFNLDAARINSVVLYEEVALRYSASGYAARSFEFFRAFLGYTWTTRRGTFITLGAVGQMGLNPAATRWDFVYGPLLSVAWRVSPPGAESAPPPPDVDVQ